MKEPFQQYARFGFVHHMLYPESMSDSDLHADTLDAFVQRNDMDTFDCCLPYGADRRRRLVERIRNSGKTDKVFAAHLFPMRKLSPCAADVNEQAQVRLIMQDMIDQAVSMGAEGFIVSSGGPSPDQACEANYRAFAKFCRWLCGELREHGITVLLEPFDMTIDKKFLYGSTDNCVALIRSLEPEVDNMAIELDVAHVPLMGETFEHAINTVAPYLKRVHLGNCVLKDKTNPRYGDTHPPVGFDGGEIDIPELTDILRCLLDVGFLNTQTRGSVLLEMTPWPGRSVEESIADSLDRLEKAWNAV